MASPRTPILCIAGTGPGVGKTAVAVGLVRRAIALGGHPVGVKPVDVGCVYGDDHDLVSADGERLRAARGRPLPPLLAAPYRFPSKTTPLLAARRAGITLRLEHVAEAVRAALPHGDVLLVEVPASALSPLTEDGDALDLARLLDARLLVVGRAELEADGSLLGLLECARGRGVPVGGVLLASAGADEDVARLEALVAERARVTVFPSLLGGTVGQPDVVLAHLAEHRVLERVFSPSDP